MADSLERWWLGAPPGQYTILLEVDGGRRVHGHATARADGSIEVTGVHVPAARGCCDESPGQRMDQGEVQP